MAPTPSNVRPPDEPLMLIDVAACAGAGNATSAHASVTSRLTAAAQARDGRGTGNRRRFGPPSSGVVIAVVPFCRGRVARPAPPDPAAPTSRPPPRVDVIDVPHLGRPTDRVNVHIAAVHHVIRRTLASTLMPYRPPVFREEHR